MAINLLVRTISLLLSYFVAWGTAQAQSSIDQTNAASLVLALGRSIELPAPAGLSVSISNGSILRASDLGSRLKVTGKKLGESTLAIGTKKFSVSVVSEPVYRLHQRLSVALADRRGLELAIDGQILSVKGRLLRWEDWLALSEASSGSKADWSFEAEMSTELQARAETSFKSMLRTAHLPDFSIEVQPSAVVSLPKEMQDLKPKLTKLLGPFGFRVESNGSTLTLEPLVRVRIVVAEFRKKMMSRIGLEWPTSVKAQLLPAFQVAGSDLLLGINALEENGLGKILASPTLLCRSGKEAQFLAGGEFPIKLSSYKSSGVAWKKYGIVLNIKPKADFSGRMSIAIETEVSMIDTSQVVDGIPGLLTNRIQSHFDLSSSRTIALSGLIKKEWGESNSGLAGVSSLPILGSLFSSREYHDNLTELVVFVTPEVTTSESEAL